MPGKIVPLRDGEKIGGALSLIRQGVAVFPLWWPEEGRCGCGNPVCRNVGKHPLGKLVPQGFKNGSKDETTIKRWWAAYPKANIGVVTGRVSGIVVVDVDGAKGQAKLAALLSNNDNILEPRNYVETGRLDGGHHY
jgi:putative DNA primase/helicase